MKISRQFIGGKKQKNKKSRKGRMKMIYSLFKKDVCSTRHGVFRDCKKRLKQFSPVVATYFFHPIEIGC
ncbi:hypothetical protein BMS3Abin03_03127 [bacterium BMS3Abin03]|nr:hypothetical protein BMS3Abin03_03127 [bacterium BMS3Abin03]